MAAHKFLKTYLIISRECGTFFIALIDFLSFPTVTYLRHFQAQNVGAFHWKIRCKHLCNKPNPSNSLMTFWPDKHLHNIQLSWWICIMQRNQSKDVSGWNKISFPEASDHSPFYQLLWIVMIKIMPTFRNAEWIWFGVRKQGKCKAMQKWSRLNTKYEDNVLESSI